MKAFVALFALAVTALAESEPWLSYGYGGYGVALASPCRNALRVPVPCALGKKKREAEAEPWLGLGYGGYGIGYGLVSACHNAWGAPVPCAGKKKREAEAEPWLGLGYAGYGLGYGHVVSACHNAWGAPVPCAGKKKREAEAEPWLGLGYAGIAHTGLILPPSDPLNPHVIHTSRLGVCLNNAGVQVPC